MKIDTLFIKNTVQYVLAEQLAHRRLTPEAVADLALELVLTLTAANENSGPLSSTTASSRSNNASTGKACLPAVAIEDSVHDDYVVCLEDGLRFSMMKRHLSEVYGMTPDEYRNRWGLPRDYPMTAPAYSRRKGEIAKKLKLGRYPRR
jgi:predicted transcriptional regulator